ncbi:MAG: hypothetical protein QOI94_1973 [Acidobacteriaceae bacterium]|nr:hypothetical protein [Acidobacteriaceae bacterium]
MREKHYEPGNNLRKDIEVYLAGAGSGRSKAKYCLTNQRSEGKEMATKPPLVVIVGGGFGGLAAAKGLKSSPVDVLLIDRSNHHVFQPLLYQVATSVLAPGQIASPIRSLLAEQPNTSVMLLGSLYILWAELRNIREVLDRIAVATEDAAYPVRVQRRQEAMKDQQYYDKRARHEDA